MTGASHLSAQPFNSRVDTLDEGATANPGERPALTQSSREKRARALPETGERC
jgi:hypothetical protein